MNSEEKIKSIIQRVLALDMNEITNDAHLYGDLGADDLEIAEIANEIDKALSINLDFEFSDLTVSEIIALANAAQPPEEKLRTLHYLFAHEILPNLLFKEGINILPKLRFKDGLDYMPNSKLIAELDSNGQPVENGLNFLYYLWNLVSKNMKCLYTAPDGLDYEIFEDQDILLILFYFPEVQIPGDAYLGLFGWNDNSLVSRSNYRETVEYCANYFTFELGHYNERVTGEWLHNGNYVKHGSYSSDKTIKQFIAEAINIMQQNEVVPANNLAMKTIQPNNQDSSSKTEFNAKEIKEVELKKAWEFLSKLNDQLPIDQRFKIGLLPWSYEHSIDPEYYDDIIIATNKIYSQEISKCGQALYISNKNGRVIFISEKEEQLKSGGITDMLYLCDGPDLTDKYGNVLPEYKGQLYPGKFILWEGDYDISFTKDTTKDGSFISYHYYKDWLGSEKMGRFKLSEKNLTQLFSNLQNNVRNMRINLKT